MNADMKTDMEEDSSETLTLRLPRSLAGELLDASQREQISASELVQLAATSYLARNLCDAVSEPLLLEQARDLVGCFGGGPKDLSSTPRHLEGFGRA